MANIIKKFKLSLSGDRFRSSDAMWPVGVIVPFGGNGDLPSGFLLCDGASVSRAMYPDLFTVIGTTYGSVDDEHFNLPNLTDKFIEGSSTAGTEKEAGLPNIEGYLTNDSYNHANFDSALTATGALYSDNITSYGVVKSSASASNRSLSIGLDASKSDSIYGNSTTVQPPALTMRYIIKAFDGETADSALIDVTKYAEELALKVNRAEADYVVDSYTDDDGNWYRVYKSGWLEQGGKKVSTGSSTYTNYTFLKPFANTNYYVSRTAVYPATQDIGTSRTTTFYSRSSEGVTWVEPAVADDFVWWLYACGQGVTE